jgi:hypothetical protein
MKHMIYVLRRKPGMTREAFSKYWREVHGPMVASYADLLGIKRYLQVHTLEPDPRPPDEVRGDLAEPHDGVAELWTDVDAATGSEAERRAAYRVLAEDERNFIDFATSSKWHGADHFFVGG